MYDEYTVVFNLPLGITIWHKDNELDGTDDSCGWSYARLNVVEKEKLKRDYECERKCIIDIYNCWDDSNRMALIYTIYSHVKWVLYKKRLKTIDYEYIMDLSLNIRDDLKIHTEFPDDEFKRLYYRIGQLVKTKHRKWYQHPKWHFWHWEIQIPKRRVRAEASCVKTH